MRYPMALLRLSPLVSVKLKYAWQKPNSSLLYFKRRVPDDIKPLLPIGSRYAGAGGKVHYVVSLQTSDPKVAALKIAKLVQETDEDWERLRNPTRESVAQQAHQLLIQAGIDPTDPKATPESLDAFEDFLDAQLPHSVRADEAVTDGRQLDRHLSPVHAAALQMLQRRRQFTLGDCLDQYIGARPAAEKDARMVFGYLFDFLGTRSGLPGKDRDIRNVRRPDVNAFVAWLLAGKHSADGKPIRTTTVERYLTNVRAAFERAIVENELGIANVFAKVEIKGKGKDAKKRQTFSVDQYRHLYRAIDQHTAAKGLDQLRCILTLVAETGARLAEIVGLATADVRLGDAVPHLNIQEHPWRSLKTLGSAREVPLTPRALAAVQAALQLADSSSYLFPAYISDGRCNADSASAALVKWVRTREGLTGTKLGNHSLRHGMEDLLRAVGCIDSVRDQITGHKTPGMGANYGEGYPLEMLSEWLLKATALPGA